MLGIPFISPGKPPTKKVKYRKNVKEGPKGGIERISGRRAKEPMLKSKWNKEKLNETYRQMQLEAGRLPTFPDISSPFSNGDGGGFGDGRGFGNGDDSFGDYDADDEDDEDPEGIEDISPTAVETYFERVKRAQQSDGNIKKRSYSTNLKRQRAHWKEFVDCVTGQFAWHAVKNWGSEDPATRSSLGPLCDCRDTIRLPTVYWTGWRLEEFIICESDCPYKSGMLGFLSKQCYPSSPKKPHFAFSTDFTEFFHHLYMGGPSSKQGFCSAVQHFLEFRLTSHPEIEYEIPKDLYENFLGVYRAWEKVKSILDIQTDILIQSAASLIPDQLTMSHLQSLVETVKLPPLPMSTLCLMCFAEDSKAAYICFDGNFQLTTLGTRLEKREGIPAQEVEDMRIFLRDISLPKESEQNLGGCLNFKAATNPKVGNRENSYTGVVLATCARHDIPLTAINVRTGGEKLVYARTLLDRIVNDSNNPDRKYYIIYDIGCTFDKYLKARMPTDEYNRLSFSVSIFHMYGHEFKCRALYNPRRISGAGLTDGEGNERVWSKSRHLIPSIRASSGESRIQVLTSNFIEIGEIQRLHFSNMLPRLIKIACSRAQESWTTLQDLLQQTNLTLTELQQQNHNMQEHYKRNLNDAKPISVHYDDEICELLLCQEAILEEVNKWLSSDIPAPNPHYHQQLRQTLAARLDGRIPPNELLPYTLDEKLKERLRLANSDLRDWFDKDGNWTQRYSDARERYHF